MSLTMTETGTIAITIGEYTQRGHDSSGASAGEERTDLVTVCRGGLMVRDG